MSKRQNHTTLSPSSAVTSLGWARARWHPGSSHCDHVGLPGLGPPVSPPSSVIALTLPTVGQSPWEGVPGPLSPSLLTHLHQEVPQGRKGGSVLGLVCPALQHDVVDVLGTVLRPWQPLTLLVYLMQDLWGRGVPSGGPRTPPALLG